MNADLKLDFIKMQKDGWKVFSLEKPSSNSFKWCLVILGTEYEHNHYEYDIQQAAWQPTSADGGYGYETGYFMQPLQLSSCNPIHGLNLNKEVIMWIPIEHVMKGYSK